MSVFIKVALGTVAVGGVGVAGCYAGGIISFGGETPWSPLSKESGTLEAGEDKIGKLFGRYLTGVYGEGNGNKKWWNESYSRLSESTDESSLSEEFAKAKVTSGFSPAGATGEDGTKALNEVCKAIYNRDKTDIEGDNGKRKDSLWKYCSPLGETPKTIKEALGTDGSGGYAEGNIGKIKEDDLLSTAANDKLWEIKTKDFFDGFSPEETSKFFRKFHNDEKDKANRSSLKTRCEEAYKQQPGTSDDNTTTEEETLRYCSLEGR